MTHEDDLKLAIKRGRAEHPGLGGQVRISSPAEPKPLFSGDKGYSPCETDFCPCGYTYQPIPKTRKRKCYVCGRLDRKLP